ncbi:hypothetical protein [Streptomyces kronopolitis]|uniref:hypothetical protein n=1 Tax=Streptomyces kronopolitis TaxID=1612435 RepID=UPI003D98FA63
MPAPDHDSLPDVAFGHHPDHGIVAANPKHLAASAWMLKGFDFHPVPDHPKLYALADQQRDGQGRVSRAVAILRKAGYQVDVDAAFDPSLAPEAARARDRPSLVDPDVAFAEHPQLGIVAATDDRSRALGGRLLEEHGWRHDPNLDIYTLPITIDRSDALEKVANATVSMHHSGLQVAAQPALAQDTATRHRPTPATNANHRRDPGFTTRSPISAAALAASPARAGLPVTAPDPAPATSAAAAKPVNPRIAFSRTRPPPTPLDVVSDGAIAHRDRHCLPPRRTRRTRRPHRHHRPPAPGDGERRLRLLRFHRHRHGRSAPARGQHRPVAGGRPHRPGALACSGHSPDHLRSTR